MNKRIIVIFACLLLLLIPIVLLSAVFVVRDVDVTSVKNADFEYDEDKIITDSLIPMNSSIFALSEQGVRRNIELHNPEIEVVNIERMFPSLVVIHINKRVPIVALGIEGTSRYALVDRTLRVVKIVDSIDEYNVIDYSECVIDIDKDISLDGNIIDLGATMQQDIRIYILASIIKGFEESGITNDKIPSVVRSINIVDNKSVSIKTKKGASIEVFMNPSGVTIDKMLRAGIAYFEMERKAGSANVTSGTYYFNTTLNRWEHRA